MTRFYFHIRNGGHQSYTDKIGEELPDTGAAWTEATKYAGEALRDLNGKLKSETDRRSEVTDDAGRPICGILLRAERPDRV
jgi:hypothetical protein